MAVALAGMQVGCLCCKRDDAGSLVSTIVCSAARDAFQQSLFEVFKRDGGFNLLQREQDEKKAAFHVVKATACFEA